MGYCGQRGIASVIYDFDKDGIFDRVDYYTLDGVRFAAAFFNGEDHALSEIFILRPDGVKSYKSIEESGDGTPCDTVAKLFDPHREEI